MNVIKIIKSSKINFEIENNLEFLLICEMDKQKEIQDLSSKQDNQLINYNELEDKAFNLIKNEGYNFKLLFLWFKYYVFCNNLEGLVEILNFIKENFEIINKLKNNNELFLILNYLDSFLAKALNNINLIYLEFKIKDFAKNREIFYEIIQKITDSEIGKLYNFLLIFNELIKELKKIYNFDFKKLNYNINYIETIINLYKDYLNNQEINEVVYEKPNAILQYKQEAFQHIEKALHILEKSDKQNLTIPILQKILKWQNYTLSEIINEFGDDNSIISFLKFISLN